jgi:LAGLIDADG DNA endonuclease family
VAEHPERVLRHVVPDAVQVQVILGSLLGDGRLEGDDGERRVRIAHPAERADYVWWKYQRLGALAAHAPERAGDRLEFRTITHPIFDDIAPYFACRDSRKRLRELLAPLGLAVWMTDVGRLQLREDAFLPRQRAVALSR